MRLGVKPEHLRHYDQRYISIFNRVYEDRYADQYESSLLTYKALSVDHLTAQMMRSHGGFLYAVKNIEGDILSEVVEAGSSHAFTTLNEVRGAKGEILFETNHGTMPCQFDRYLTDK